MDDIEERPSKIRKLDPSISLPEKSEASPANPPTSDTPHNPTTDTFDPALIPFEGNEDEETPEGNSVQTDDQPQLSKSQLKKIRKKAAWDAGKEERRLFRKQKDKEKKVRKQTLKATVKAKIASGEITAPVVNHARPQQVPVGLLLDCDFNDLMTEKELSSLGAQLTRCYSENRSAKLRTHMVISSFGGALKERFETVLKRNHDGWKGVVFAEKNFVEAGAVLDVKLRGEKGGNILGALKSDIALPKEESEAANGGEVPASVEKVVDLPEEKPQMEGLEPNNLDTSKTSNLEITPPSSLVYLSSDSPTTLTALSPYTTYIIGGIVDKNRHKGLCYKRATQLGIPTAKLPIGEFMVMNSRTVLAVNHVVEIMLRWLECGDWGVAFEKVIPKRKGGVLKRDLKAGGVEGDGGEEGEEYDEDQEQNTGYYEVKKEEHDDEDGSIKDEE